MDYFEHMNHFLERVNHDGRIGPPHISLYIALLQCWSANAFTNPVKITRNEIMNHSKINAKATYHKCIKELHNYGYILYTPSHNSYYGSWVSLL